MDDRQLSTYAQAVAEALLQGMNLEDPAEATAFRSSCEQMVRLHLQMAEGDKTMDLYIRQLATQAPMREAMKGQIHHLLGCEEIWSVTRYIALADEIAQKLSR